MFAAFNLMDFKRAFKPSLASEPGVEPVGRHRAYLWALAALVLHLRDPETHTSSPEATEAFRLDSRGRLVPALDLELLDLDVTRAGGSVRYLEGARYGLATSVFRAEVLVGTGPVPHTHDYNEVFVLIEGSARYFVGDDTIDAAAGDVVIVPASVRHAFVSVGPGTLRQIVLHEAPAFAEHRVEAGSA